MNCLGPFEEQTLSKKCSWKKLIGKDALSRDCAKWEFQNCFEGCSIVAEREVWASQDRMLVTLKNLQQQTFQIEIAATDSVSSNFYSWVNLVVPKNWVAYFSAISGQKFDLKTVLRSCWHIEWRRRGFIASGPFFSPFLTFAHEKNHFPVKI